QRTAIVTGASSGIGAEIARELAKRGHGLILVARRVQRLEELKTELADRGVRIEVMPADLSERADRERLVEDIQGGDLEVDILVNNAGLSTMGRVTEIGAGATLNIIDEDVDAVADLCARMVPSMVGRGRGAVLNVASTAAYQPLPGQAGYAACKAFVLSYTQALHAELAGTGVRATALCPGPVRTEFAEVSGLGVAAAEEALPEFMYCTATEVALAGVDGLARGVPVVIPGIANRLTAVGATVTPKRVLVPILARMHPALKR
ncbi:MAG: SDR family NAD(P)-dependent oxidoreductase, partial [Microthrixaceae bacterium]